jgi:hypothetical protein
MKPADAGATASGQARNSTVAVAHHNLRHKQARHGHNWQPVRA